MHAGLPEWEDLETGVGLSSDLELQPVGLRRSEIGGYGEAERVVSHGLDACAPEGLTLCA